MKGRNISTRWLALLGWIAISFLPSMSDIFVSPDEWYHALNKPSWTPPPWVFGPIWTILYFAMGVAAWLVFESRGLSRHSAALLLFITQLIFNGMWSLIFFGWHQIGLAFIEIVILWFLVIATFVLFRRAQKWAGILLIPYLVWLTIAAALNFSIWRLNY
jgi:benzodiazapine receptor